jgi:Predicted transcriptional regulators
MNLKKIRTKKNISVPKFAELTGMHRRTIEDIEKRGDCLVSNAILFAKVLNVTLDELCGFGEDEQTDE